MCSRGKKILQLLENSSQPTESGPSEKSNCRRKLFSDIREDLPVRIYVPKGRVEQNISANISRFNKTISHTDFIEKNEDPISTSNTGENWTTDVTKNDKSISYIKLKKTYETETSNLDAETSGRVEENISASISKFNKTISHTDSIEQNEDIISISNTGENMTLDVSKNNKSIPHTTLEKIHEIGRSCLDAEISDRVKKVATKKNFCIYCKKLVTKIPRHFEAVHKDEKEVKDFLNLPKGSHQRKLIIAKIRKDGNFLFNTDKDQNPTENIIRCRRTRKENGKKVPCKPCPQCKGFIAITSLKRHIRNCCKRIEKGRRNILIQSRMIHGQIHQKACSILKNVVFPVLRDDEVTDEIRYDELVIIYGNKLCTKYRSEHHHKMIRSRLRSIGRFLLALKKINTDITDFANVFQPKYYDNVVTAINSVANLKEDAATYAAPATAFALGTAIKYNCGLFITECIKSQNIAKKELAKEFLDLLIQDLASSVNKTVNENMLTYKRQKKIVLPKLDDIKILQSYLSENRKKYFNDLKINGFSYKIWKELASFTLVSVQVFNRRRAGEIERALISDFSNYQAVTKDTDPKIFKSLSQESQEATKRYVRFEIRGKLARGVPVLLSLELLECVDLILRHRESAAVPKENPFIFGLPCTGSKINNHLLATHLLRKYSTDCGAKNPSTLRGTQLRKHIASQSAVFNLKENEVQDLANFMGHSDKIHRDHYQTPIITRDIAQISKILEQAQGSNKDNELQHERDQIGIELQETGTMTCESKRINLVDGDNQHKFSTDISVTDSDSDYSDAQTNASSTTSSPKRYKKRKGVIHRKTWSTPEKRTARSIFHEHLMKNTLPSFKECIQAIKSHTNLESRTAAQLKLWVHNQNVNSKQRKDSMLSPRRRKHSWATPEKTAIREAFADHMENNYPPSFSECRRAIETYPALKSRSVRMIKAYVYSNIRRKTQN